MATSGEIATSLFFNVMNTSDTGVTDFAFRNLLLLQVRYCLVRVEFFDTERRFLKCPVVAESAELQLKLKYA
jgi:hypothetical protein